MKTNSTSMNYYFPLLLLTSLWVISCSSSKEEDHKSSDKAEAHYTLPGLDHGLIQSPINILTSSLSEANRHEISVTVNRGDNVTGVVNKGHTIELEFNPGTVVTFDQITYEFKQAHFHTPSEHQIDGITFPMEMHFVCKEQNKDSKNPEYLVVAAFFKMGNENNFISGFINKIPTHENDTILLTDDPVYVEDLIGDLSPEMKYYHYKGSLTTPPYSETVNWLILREIIEASAEQIQIINAKEGNNARHVQALFKREIEAN